MSKTMIKLPEFEEKKFYVSAYLKTEILDWILQVLLEWLEQKSFTKALNIRGGRGSGKTWLSLYLKRCFIPNHSRLNTTVKPFLLFFDQYTKEDYFTNQDLEAREYFVDQSDSPDPKTIEKSIADFFKIFCSWLELENVQVDENDLFNTSRAVIEAYLRKEFSEKHVIICDSVFESNLKYLRQMEEHFFEPFATIPGMFFIMTARTSGFPWKSSALRASFHRRKLKHLSLAETGEQIDLFLDNPQISNDEVYEISGGYQLSNYVIASNQDESIERLLGILLRIERHETNIGNKTLVLQDAFEALCVLDGFRIEDILPILAAHRDDTSYIELGIPGARELIELMEDTHLVEWDNGAYRMNNSIVIPLRRYLRREKYSIGLRVVTTAHELYLHYADIYKENEDLKSTFEDMADMVLKENNFDPNEIEAYRESARANLIPVIS